MHDDFFFAMTYAYHQPRDGIDIYFPIFMTNHYTTSATKKALFTKKKIQLKLPLTDNRSNNLNEVKRTSSVMLAS